MSHNLVGVDEVGRGSWAGPLLVVAAQAISDLPEGLTDSKLLTKKQREEVVNLLSSCCSFGEGWVTVGEIDRWGLAKCLKLGILRALESLSTSFDDEIVFDGKVNYIPTKFTNAKCMVDADLKIPLVSAASIYAKVTRDKFMQALSLKHPRYGFEKHVGYGTAAHRSAIQKFGVLPAIHRTSYKPIAALLS